jgi:hypothetical protein
MKSPRLMKAATAMCHSWQVRSLRPPQLSEYVGVSKGGLVRRLLSSEAARSRPLTLLISSVWPEPTSTAAGTRTLEILKTFAGFGHDLALASPSVRTSRSASRSSILELVGADDIREISVKPNDAAFDEMLRELQPNLVVFDRFFIEEQFGWRVSDVLPHALRLVDSQDLHFLREYRASISKPVSEFNGRSDHLVADGWNSSLAAIDSDIAVRELASFARCDIALVISTSEKELLRSLDDVSRCFLPHQLTYLPFLPDVSKFVDSPSLSFEERSSPLVMIGNFLHKPNADSVRCLRRYYQQSATVSQLPIVHVYGSYCPSEFGVQNFGSLPKGKLLDNNKIVVFGSCENAMDTIGRYRVLLAPLRYGAGLKGKLFDAILSRTPFVTSKIGAEGIIDFRFVDGRYAQDNFVICEPTSKDELHNQLAYLCVAETIHDAITKSDRLCSNKALWSHAVHLSRKLLFTEFNSSTHRASFKKCLDEALRGNVSDINSFSVVAKVRNSPERFLQRMLTHETVHNAKMFSKYLSLKSSLTRNASL